MRGGGPTAREMRPGQARVQPPDSDAAPTKHMHVKFNPWELEQLAAIARRECVPMTSLVRRMVRANLLEQKR